MSTIKNVLQNRTLLIIGVAESISQIGDWITMMAVFALVIFRGEGTVMQSSGIYLAGLLPTLLCAPLAGWLCDRFDRKKLMIASQLLSGVVVSGLIFVTRLEWVYVLLALEAVSVSVMAPARTAVIPGIVSPEDLTRANAFLQQLSSIIKIVSPMLAGAVLAVLNPHQAIILDVISFILSAVLLSRLPRLLPAHSSETSPNRETKGNGSLRVLGKIPLLQILFAATFLCILVVVGFDVLASVYLRDTLHQNEQFFGLVIGLVGVGTLAGTLMLMLRKGEGNPWRDLVIGILLLAVIPLSMVAAENWQGSPIMLVATLGGMLAGGVGNCLVLVQSGTLLQTLAPREILGQVSGIFQSILTAGQLIGIILVPLLVPGAVSIVNYFLLSILALVLLASLIPLVLARSRARTVQQFVK